MKLKFGDALNVLTALCVVVLTVIVVNRARGTVSDRGESQRGNIVTLSSDVWSELRDSRLSFGSSSGIEIVEFSDFECPACRGFSERVLARLKEDSTLDVRFTFRHYPLSYHRFAMPAARAAECAKEQNRFWQMHDELFQSADSLGLKTFEDFASDAGVPDISRFSACLVSDRTDSLIQQDIALGRRLPVQKTPTVIVDGQILPSTPTLEELLARIASHRRAQGER